MGGAVICPPFEPRTIMKKGKVYRAFAEAIEADKVYTAEEAVEFIKENSKRKFDESVELHVRLGIDPRKSEQSVRGTVVLPHGSGKDKRVAAIVSPEKVDEAKKAGADVIIGEEEIKEIAKTKKIDFDIAVAEPQMMRALGPVAKILGQKGLMPNPKTETVGTNVEKMVSDLKSGKIAYKNDDSGNVHQSVGKVSWDAERLVENVNVFVDAIKKAKPDEMKGTYLQKITISTTMGPGIKIQA